MYRSLTVLALMLMPTVVMAQSAGLETTCQSVLKSFLLSNAVSVGAVQSFPELKPPGVRMTYSARQRTAPAEMTDTFECEFDKVEKPHQLSRFCVSSTCYSEGEDNGDRKRRFEEMRVLLDRSEK